MAGKTQRFKAVRIFHVGEKIKVVAKQTYADGRPFFEFGTEVVGKLIIASRNWCLIDMSEFNHELDLYYDGDTSQWFLFGPAGHFPVYVSSLIPLAHSVQGSPEVQEFGLIPKEGQVYQLDGKCSNTYQPWVVEEFILLGKAATVGIVEPVIHIPVLFPSYCIWKDHSQHGIKLVGIRNSTNATIQWELHTSRVRLAVDLTIVRDPLLA